MLYPEIPRLTIDNQSTSKFAVTAPIGGFGNHMRWLLFLDPSIKFSITITPEYYYKFAKSNTWPSYTEFIENNYEGISEQAKIEINQSIANGYLTPSVKLFDIDSKLSFIKTSIYPEQRSWHNWLYYEWSYRIMLDKIIPFYHSISESNTLQLKTIALTIAPDFALHSYLKFNSSLNNITLDGFKEQVSKENFYITRENLNPNIHIIQAEQLYQQELDKTLYESIVNWLQLTDCYDCANYVHQLWYQLQLKSQKEFVNYINKIY